MGIYIFQVFGSCNYVNGMLTIKDDLNHSHEVISTIN